MDYKIISTCRLQNWKSIIILLLKDFAKRIMERSMSWPNLAHLSKIKFSYRTCRSHSKPVKRLQSSHTSEKLIKYDENLHRTLKSDSSLSTVNSNSPPSYQSLSHEPAVDSTTPTYLDNSVGDHEQDSEVNPSPQKFDSSNSYPYYYPPAAIYGSYSNDPQSIMYNTSYNYIASTSGINSPSTSMSFNSYGSYPTPAYYPPQYNPSFF